MAKEASILLNLLSWHPRKISRIIAHYSDLDEILQVSFGKLRKDAFLSGQDIEQFLRMRDSKEFQRELAAIRSEAVTCIDIFDDAYPELLKHIDNPPLVLYVRGSVAAFNGIVFAIVGSRTPTRYGLAMAERFSSQLAALGVVVISGLADGIDTAAHRAAIENGKSLAVLGSGLLRIYPRHNEKLAVDIIRHGALISEFGLFVPPDKENFPRRNRIISGLSRGVLVVEAAERSGALITAHLAAEQNREVFVIPGNIDSPLSKGTNTLIKEGAQPIDCLEDVLGALGVNQIHGKIFSYR